MAKRLRRCSLVLFVVCMTLKNEIQQVSSAGGPHEDGKLTKIWKRAGTSKIDLDTAGAGDIVSLTGLNSARIADTIGSATLAQPLEPGHIEPPTLR